MKTPVPSLARSATKLGLCTSLLWTVSLAPMQAVLIAYDGFDDTPGAIGGQAGGTGWSGAWTNQLSATSTTAGSLDYTNGGALLTSGNKAAASGYNGDAAMYPRRALNDKIDSGTVYISFLFSHGELAADNKAIIHIGLFDGDTQQAVFGQRNSEFSVAASVPYPDARFDGSNLSAAGTYMAVLKVEYNDANTVFSLYGNPNLSTGEPLTPNVTLTKGIADGRYGFDQIALNFFGGTTPHYDEIRIGTTWADVTPVPEPDATALIGVVGLVTFLRRKR